MPMSGYALVTGRQLPLRNRALEERQTATGIWVFSVAIGRSQPLLGERVLFVESAAAL